MLSVSMEGIYICLDYAFCFAKLWFIISLATSSLTKRACVLYARLIPPRPGRMKLLEPTLVEAQSILPTAPVPHNQQASPTTPVPEFDWSASGLTNPLRDNDVNLPASEVDLEFFEDMPSKANSKPPPAISKLEAEFLSPASPLPRLPPPPAFPPILLPDPQDEKPSDEEIPPCVVDILPQLPDFSYMRKTILAFPIVDQVE
uniref:RUN domain-containing protein n=1 Tax=Mesocestoides corti TaxID=53468 RepID=A0A5K3EGG6_MESCO